MASILRSYLNSTNQEHYEESQKRAIFEAVARLIRSDIKANMPPVENHYPTTKTLKLQSALDYFPESLQILLNALFVGKDMQQKIAIIGYTIMQAVQPWAVFAPLQIGPAVWMQP